MNDTKNDIKNGTKNGMNGVNGMNGTVHDGSHSLPSPVPASPSDHDIFEDLRQEIEGTRGLALSLRDQVVVPVSDNSQDGMEGALQQENDQLREMLQALEQRLEDKALRLERVKDRHRQDIRQKDTEIRSLKNKCQKAEQEAEAALRADDSTKARMWRNLLKAERMKSSELSLQTGILERRLLEKEDSHEVWKHKYVCFF